MENERAAGASLNADRRWGLPYREETASSIISKIFATSKTQNSSLCCRSGDGPLLRGLKGSLNKHTLDVLHQRPPKVRGQGIYREELAVVAPIRKMNIAAPLWGR